MRTDYGETQFAFNVLLAIERTVGIVLPPLAPTTTQEARFPIDVAIKTGNLRLLLLQFKRPDVMSGPTNAAVQAAGLPKKHFWVEYHRSKKKPYYRQHNNLLTIAHAWPCTFYCASTANDHDDLLRQAAYPTVMISETLWVEVRKLKPAPDADRPHGLRYLRDRRVWECSDPVPLAGGATDPSDIFGRMSAREQLANTRGTDEQWQAIGSVIADAEEAIFPILKKQGEEQKRRETETPLDFTGDSRTDAINRWGRFGDRLRRIDIVPMVVAPRETW